MATASVDERPREADRSRVRALWSDSLGRAATRALQVLLLVVAAAVVVWALAQLQLVVIPFLIATIIAAAMSPAVRYLVRRGMRRALATWLVLLATFTVLAGLATVVVMAVRDEWGELRTRADEGLDELQTWLTDTFPITQSQIDRARQAVSDIASGDEFRSGAITGAVAAVEVVTGLFLMLVILFFLLKDGDRIWAFVTRPVQPHLRDRVDAAGERAVDALGGYVRGTTVVAAVDAFFIGIALFILGVPLALPLAVVVFLTAYIPLVGATVAGALAALVALVANGPTTALIVVAVVIAVNQIEGDVLAPLVLGRAVALHPLVILLALAGGTVLAGILGALLAVPLVAVAWAVVSSWTSPREPAHDEAAHPPAPT